MNKTAAIAAILAATSTQPIVFTTGYACRIASNIADRPNHFYMTGSMGLASTIGIGVAMETRRITVVVDGDGSLLMNPASLLTAGALYGLPLIHVVLDDGCYASTGGQVSPGARADLCGLARAAGYRRVAGTARLGEFNAILQTTFNTCEFPAFIHCTLTEVDPSPPGRIAVDLGEHAARFRASIT